jgi:hypothetical protein
MSVPDFGPSGPSTVVIHSSIRSAQSVYCDRNREAFQQEKKENDGVVEDPITLEEMPEYIPGKTISYLRMTDKNIPVKLQFFTLEALEQCLARSINDPFTNQPWKGAMRQRVEIAAKARDVADGQELNIEEIKPLFREFIADPVAFKQKKPVKYRLMDQNLHIGDAGILSSWGAINDDTLRAKAIATLENAEQGAWLIRNASVKSNDLTTIQALSYVFAPRKQTCTDPPVFTPATIRHILIMRVSGYGYAIVESASGQKMPDLDTKDIPLPKHGMVYGSFLDVMSWMHARALHFKLHNMKVNE